MTHTNMVPEVLIKANLNRVHRTADRLTLFLAAIRSPLAEKIARDIKNREAAAEFFEGEPDKLYELTDNILTDFSVYNNPDFFFAISIISDMPENVFKAYMDSVTLNYKARKLAMKLCIRANMDDETCLLTQAYHWAEGISDTAEWIIREMIKKYPNDKMCNTLRVKVNELKEQITELTELLIGDK